MAQIQDEIIPEPKAGSLWRLELARKAVRGAIPLPLNDVQEEKRARCFEEDRELRQDMVMWSVEQCASFFQDSHPQLAEIISKHVKISWVKYVIWNKIFLFSQELMGSALVLISRSQFLDLFGLPVGTALNLHAEVCRTRRLFFWKTSSYSSSFLVYGLKVCYSVLFFRRFRNFKSMSRGKLLVFEVFLYSSFVPTQKVYLLTALLFHFAGFFFED